MDLKQQDLIELTKYLYMIDAEIQANNENGHTDINNDMEDVSTHILNILLSLNLKNINLKSKNNPAFDLVDDDKKILIQVTSTVTNKKIKETINKYKKLNKQYSQYTLYIFFLCKEFNETKERRKFIDDGLIKKYYCFKDIIDIAKSNNEIFLRLKNYLFIHNKDNTIYTTKILQYYSNNNKLQDYTTSNFNEYINNCKSFFKVQTQVLHIHANSGCGKSHLINYIIEKQLYNNYIPILIYNQTTSHNFFDDFNKNINWLFILDDIELFDTNLLSSIFEYIVEYKNSKLIITSQNNLDRTLPELNSLTTQDIFIEWNENKLKELEQKYRKNNKKITRNNITINNIIKIVKDNPALFIYIMNNDIQDIYKYKTKLYKKLKSLFKEIPDNMLNHYLFIICINHNINDISNYLEQKRDIQIMMNILRNNNIIKSQNNIYKFNNHFIRSIIGAMALDKGYEQILFDEQIPYFKCTHFQYLKNIYTYLNDNRKHLVINDIKHFLTENTNDTTLDNTKYFAEYMTNYYYNALIKYIYNDNSNYDFSYFVLNTKITDYIKNNLYKYLNIVYIATKNSYTINKFYFKYFLNDLSESIINTIKDFYNKNKYNRDYDNYFFTLFDALYDFTVLYSMTNNTYSCSFSYNINNKAIVNFLFEMIDEYCNLAISNDKAREIIKFMERYNFTGEYEKTYNILIDKCYKNIETYIEHNLFVFKSLINLRVSLIPYINSRNSEKYKYLLSKIYSNKYLYLYLIGISEKLYKFNTDISDITNSRGDNANNIIEFINNYIHNFTTDELEKVFRQIDFIYYRNDLFYTIMFSNDDLYNKLLSNNYDNLAYHIKILLAKCKINKNNIKVDDFNKPEEYLSFIEMLCNDTTRFNNKNNLNKYYSLANKFPKHCQYNLYVFYDIVIQNINKLDKVNVLWLFNKIYENIDNNISYSEKYISFLYTVLKFLIKDLEVIMEDYKYQIYFIICKHIRQLYIYQDKIIDIYNLFNNTINDFNYFISEFFSNINYTYSPFNNTLPSIIKSQQHFDIIIETIVKLFKQNRKDFDFLLFREILNNNNLYNFYNHSMDNAINNHNQIIIYILLKISFIDYYNESLYYKIFHNIYPILNEYNDFYLLNNFICIYYNADYVCWKYIYDFTKKYGSDELNEKVELIYNQYKKQKNNNDTQEIIPDLPKLTEPNHE